jgi:hypothetical protein
MQPLKSHEQNPWTRKSTLPSRPTFSDFRGLFALYCSRLREREMPSKCGKNSQKGRYQSFTVWTGGRLTFFVAPRVTEFWNDKTIRRTTQYNKSSVVSHLRLPRSLRGRYEMRSSQNSQFKHHLPFIATINSPSGTENQLNFIPTPNLFL